MRLLLLLFFSIINPVQPQQQPSAAFTLTTFKNVPDDLTGCGNCYYLSATDKKKGRLLCLDALDELLVYINGKPIRFKPVNLTSKKKETSYTYKSYTLIIKTTYQKQLDDEYYVLKGIITLKKGGKIVYTQPVIGNGGC